MAERKKVTNRKRSVSDTHLNPPQRSHSKQSIAGVLHSSFTSSSQSPSTQSSSSPIILIHPNNSATIHPLNLSIPVPTSSHSDAESSHEIILHRVAPPKIDLDAIRFQNCFEEMYVPTLLSPVQSVDDTCTFTLSSPTTAIKTELLAKPSKSRSRGFFFFFFFLFQFFFFGFPFISFFPFFSSF